MICSTLGRATAVVAVAMLAPFQAAAQLPRQDFPEPVLQSLQTGLDVYEELRRELASDELEGLPAGATRLADALRSALDGGDALPTGVPETIEGAVQNAESLANTADFAAARAQFGEVSRDMLLLAGADPRLTEGRNVFACPMVKTFAKWIQPSETLDNPYMGKAMPACGFPTDWSVPGAKEEAPPKVQSVSSGQPEFKPGIPGIKMVDVRDHKFLWREIDELQSWERSERISVSEFRSKAIEKTAHFLGFRGAQADKFAALANQAVDGVREAFHRMRQSGENPGGAGTRFASDLGAEVERMNALLDGAPRHQLFEPDCKKWLLKLAFGPKEAKERGQSQAGSE